MSTSHVCPNHPPVRGETKQQKTCWCVLCACGALLVRHLDQVRGECVVCFAKSAAEVTQ